MSPWPSTSRARPSAPSEFSEYKANRSLDARRLPRPGRPHQGACSTRSRSRSFAVDGFEADDVIATLATQAEAAGYRRADRHGRPRRVPAGQRQRDGALPDARASPSSARIDPGAVDGASYGLTPVAVPGLRGAARRPERQPARHPGRRGEDRRQVDPSSGRWTALVDRVDEVKGKAGELPRAPRAREAEPPADRDGPRRRAGRGAGRLVARPCDREAVHRLLRRAEIRVLRERLFATLTGAEPEARGLEVAGGVELGTVRCWLDTAPGAALARRGARRGGRWAGRDVDGIGAGRGGPSSGGRAAAARRRRAAWFDSTALDAGRRARRSRPGSPTRSVPKVAAQRKGAMHGLPRARLDARGRHQGHRAGRLPGPAGQRSFDLADLALRYLRRELRAERAPETASCRLRRGRRRPTRAAQALMAQARASGAGRRARRRAASGRRPPSCSPSMELPLLSVLARHGAAGIAADRDASGRDGAEFAGAVQAGGEGGARRRRQASSTSGRPSSCRRCSSTSWACRRRSDQDRLHHGRGRAAPGWPTQTDHECLSHMLRHRDATQAEGHRRGPAQDRSPPTAASTPPSTRRRRDRPAVLHRPEPAEHADPHRRGPADPRRVRRR